MSLVLVATLGVLMVIAAVVALYSRDIVASMVAAGVVSLFASIVFVVYGAPDVAMTEAAIGSALTTVVFLFAWSRIRGIASRDDSTDGEIR